MTRSDIARGWFILCNLGCLLLAGCGPGRGDLAGKVTFQGKAVKVGSVSAVGSDGIPKTEAIGQDGAYHIANIPAGPIKIAVTSPDPALSQPKPRKRDEPPPKVDRQGWFPIPEKYSDFSTSDLTFELKAGTNVHNIVLE